jgi:hypothetical protein
MPHSSSRAYEEVKELKKYKYIDNYKNGLIATMFYSSTAYFLFNLRA